MSSPNIQKHPLRVATFPGQGDLPKPDFAKVRAATDNSLKRECSSEAETLLKQSLVDLEKSPLGKRVKTPSSSSEREGTRILGKEVCRILSFGKDEEMASSFVAGKIKQTTRLAARHLHPLVQICAKHPHHDDNRHPAVEAWLNRIFQEIESPEKRNSELSFLIALLDHNSEIPTTASTDSLCEHRQAVMLAQIQYMQSQLVHHATSATSPPPSAIPCYIVRALARTLYSPLERFNQHTVDMAKRLFHSSIKASLLPEHQDLIQTMLDNMFRDHEDYAELFSNIASGELAPHPSLQPLVLLDWLLPPDYPYTPKITVWALIQAILTPSGQIYGGICYAVAGLNVVRLSHSLKWLTTLASLLHAGMIPHPEIAIPLAPLMPLCLKDPRITKLVIPTEAFSTLPLTSHILKSLNTAPRPSCEPEIALGRGFLPEDRKEANKLLAAFSQNAMHLLFTVIAQTVELNYSRDCGRIQLIQDIKELIDTDMCRAEVDLLVTTLRSCLFMQELILREPIPGDPTEANFLERKLIWLLPPGENPVLCYSIPILKETLQRILKASSKRFSYLTQSSFYHAFYDSIIHRNQPAAVKKILSHHRLLATETTGGQGINIIKHLFDLAVISYHIPETFAANLFIKLHTWTHDHPDASTAIISLSQHAAVFMPQILRSLSRARLGELMHAQQEGAHYSCTTKFSSLSLSQWKNILHTLGITANSLSPHVAYTAMAFGGQQHPYVIAHDFFHYCQLHGLLSLSLFECYLQICSTLDCAPLLPFVDLNWRSDDDSVESQPFKLLALIYDRDKKRYCFCEAYGNGNLIPEPEELPLPLAASLHVPVNK